MRLEEKLGSDDAGEAGYPVPLGPYLLLHRLAKGGMGEVHLAKLGGLAGIEKYCVVKTLRRGALEDDDAVRRFMDEARVVVNLAHRNICSVFDVGRADERYYLAMEHVAGRDLRAVMERASEKGVPISPALALHLASEVLEALDYAHRLTHPATGEALHLVHRDVSPANVMVSVEGEVKLIDFGLALSRVKQQRTEPHMVMGKLAYMAPEQLACERADKRTDLFAAAVLLYELLVADRFYGDLNDGGIVHAAATGSYVPPKLSELDGELQVILRRALHRDRAQRTSDCGELRHQLGQYGLKQQLSAGSRELRALMESLFPEERERVRGLLGRFANVQSLPRPTEAPAAPAPAGQSSADVVPLRSAPSATKSAAEPLFADFDTYDFETSDPCTPVGRVRLAKAAPETAKPGTPRPELLDRLGIVEPEASPAALSLDDDDAFDEPTQVVARAPRRPKRASRLPLAAGVALVACAPLLFLILRAQPGAMSSSLPEAAAPNLPAPLSSPLPPAPPAAPSPHPAEATAAKLQPPQEVVALAESPPAADVEAAIAPPFEAPEPVADPAGRVVPTASAQESRLNVADATADTAKEVRRAPRKQLRRIQKPRSVAKKLTPPGPGAKAEQKIRYLDGACRKTTPCAGSLVDMFRGMRVDDARTFWPRVDACLSRCVQ